MIGIINHHKAQITVSAANIVLAPGKNRITAEQEAVLRTDKFVPGLVAAGLLEFVAAAPVAEPEQEPAPAAQPEQAPPRKRRR